MLYVKKLENGQDAAQLSADKALVGEDVLVRISRLGFTLSYLPSASAQWRSFPPSDRASFLIQTPGTLCFGSFLDDKLIGVCAVRVASGGWSEILDIRVDAASRRLGAGKAMLDACQSWAEARHTAGLKLITTDLNPGMCQFCEHVGFKLQGMDRFALAMTESERNKPLAQRACELIFYRTNDRE
ncbi:MAG: GNAT family N-acetyltransferase [Clostridia bacterium]|nr:GNAT family N-acetyltransferase [Clostridia bacterium]